MLVAAGLLVAGGLVLLGAVSGFAESAAEPRFTIHSDQVDLCQSNQSLVGSKGFCAGDGPASVTGATGISYLEGGGAWVLGTINGYVLQVAENNLSLTRILFANCSVSSQFYPGVGRPDVVLL